MRALVWSIAVSLSTAVAAAPAQTPGETVEPRVYRLDAAHSDVEFEARYLKLMGVEGRFREWDAAVVAPETPGAGAIAIVFRTVSLDTGNETRDDHLRSPDFFDAERYPAIVFASGDVRETDDGGVARGTLEMHGVRREIAVPFRAAYAPTTDAKGNRRAGFVGEVTIDRTAFGIEGGNRFNAGFDPLVSVIDDEVEIAFSIQAMVPPIRSAAVDSLVAAVETDGVEPMVAAWNAAFPAGEGEEVERARMRMAGLHNAAGFRLLEAGRADAAVELLRLAVLGAPGSARALSGLAEGYARAGRFDAAREAARRTLEMDPHEVRALALLAWLDGR